MLPRKLANGLISIRKKIKTPYRLEEKELIELSGSTNISFEEYFFVLKKDMLEKNHHILWYRNRKLFFILHEDDVNQHKGLAYWSSTFIDSKIIELSADKLTKLLKEN